MMDISTVDGAIGLTKKIAKRTSRIFLENKLVPPTVFLVVTTNPETGQILETPAVAMIQPEQNVIKEEEKTLFIAEIKNLANLSKAVASITVVEAWENMLDSNNVKITKEAVFFILQHQRMGSKHMMWRSAIVRDGENATLEDMVEIPVIKTFGLFTNIIPLFS